MKIATNSGIVLGKLDKDIYSFKGIPYAEPPVGKNRWLPTNPITPWSEIKIEHFTIIVKFKLQKTAPCGNYEVITPRWF